MLLLIQTLLSGLQDASLYLMLSLGLTLLFGVFGLVNFAQGDFMTIAAYVGVGGVAVFGLTSVASLLLMIPTLLLVGFLFYLTVLVPTERHPDENRLLATFGVAFVLQGIVWAVWGVNPVAALQSSAAVRVAAVTIPLDLIQGIVVATVAVVALFVFLNRTRIGREIRATSQDPVGAELIGIDTRRARLWAMLVSSALTATGGLMLFTGHYLTPQVGFTLVLSAFTVVIVAGLGSIGGTVVASLILGIATQFVASYLDASFANIVPSLVIILVLILRPNGLRGRAA